MQRLEVRELSPETSYCFALVAEDERGNRGGLSNSPCAATPGQPPSTITGCMPSRAAAPAQADLVRVELSKKSAYASWAVSQSRRCPARSSLSRWAAFLTRMECLPWGMARGAPSGLLCG